MSVGMTVNDTVLAPLFSQPPKLRAQFNIHSLSLISTAHTIMIKTQSNGKK